jgi:hypothetical protein
MPAAGEQAMVFAARQRAADEGGVWSGVHLRGAIPGVGRISVA